MEKTQIEYEDKVLDIYIHPKDYIGNIIKKSKTFYEIEFLGFVKDNYKNQRNILDIGANIGNHSLFFAEFITCDKIYSFEPCDINIQLLKKNMENYNYKNTIYEFALSNENTNKPLYNTSHLNYGGYSLCNFTNGSSYIVNYSIKTVTLDSLNLENVSMMKIDVENHENEVLQGSKQTILKNKPIIFLENSYYYHSHIFPDPEPCAEIFKELNYIKIHSNICNSSMDLWISNNM